MNRIIFVFIFSGISFLSNGQSRITADEYIRMYKDIAIREMKRTGVPASIKLAQGILEAESGNSNLVLRSNNHFGIKCKTGWSGESVFHDDDERGECFRKYNSSEDSYRDHSDFLRNSTRYASLFNLRTGDYKGWAHGLKKAGYATNPRYPQILIYNIEKYKLHQYDQQVIELEDEQELADVKEIESTDTAVSEESNEEPADFKVKTKRNGLIAIYASGRSSLLAIATFHGVSLSRLLEYNDLKSDGLLENDCWIYLERKHREAAQDYHIALTDETPHSIAQSHGIQLKSLLEFNGISELTEIQSGQKLRLKSISQNQSIRKEPLTHQVEPKEGLYAISRKYNLSVQQIRELNNLTSDNLQVGQKLIISK